MTPAVIMSLLFVAFAAACLFYIIFGNGRFCKSVFRPYLIGVCSVYLSGTVLIAAVLLFAPVLQTQFAIASELCVLFMFIMSAFTVIKLGENMESIREQAEVQKIKGIVDDMEERLSGQEEDTDR